MLGSNGVRRIGIVALGLIGASLAKALQRAKKQARRAEVHFTNIEIVGFTDSQEILDIALQEQVIDEAVCIPRILESPDWQKKLEVALKRDAIDVFILCTPVEIIPVLAREIHASMPKALISDVGSVKGPIMKACHDLPFVGGHPMAGSERMGYYCSSESLFENATYAFILPESEIFRDLIEEKVPILELMVQMVGARPLWLDANSHDELVARISHLPHVLASALVTSALGTSHVEAISLAAGGFRDISRIASSDPGLWTGICLESGNALIDTIDAFRDTLDSVRDAIVQGDKQALYAFFEQARDMRALIPNKGVGPLVSDVQIRVSIADKPGVLADITALLSRANINIHNLSIQDARFYESGQVRIFISSQKEAQEAIRILKEANYDVEE